MFEDGIVGGDVEVVGLRVEVGGVPRRDAGVVLLARGRHAAHGAVFARLGHCAVGEVSAVDVIGAARKQVQRNRGELSRRAALQKQHGVVVRHAHQFAHERLGFIEDFQIHLGTVAHFHHGHAGAAIAQHFPCRGLERLCGHGGGAGGEIVYAVHCAFSLLDQSTAYHYNGNSGTLQGKKFEVPQMPRKCADLPSNPAEFTQAIAARWASSPQARALRIRRAALRAAPFPWD